jgi:hypothetical protein
LLLEITWTLQYVIILRSKFFNLNAHRNRPRRAKTLGNLVLAFKYNSPH